MEPTIEAAAISRDRLDKIRHSIQPDAAGPLILALEHPGNTRELKQLIWAGTAPVQGDSYRPIPEYDANWLTARRS